MIQNQVIVVLVCHNMDIVNSILADNTKQNYHILFVGDKPISNEIHANPRITIAKNLQNNIENEKELLTFTAWFAIIKNNLFMEYEYICILEYDVHLEHNFESELIKKCQMKTYDIISFLFYPMFFALDVKENVMNFFLNKKGLTFKNLDSWFATTNHCLKRSILTEFVDWYYPDCLDIKKLDPTKVSWYHERLFNSFMDSKSYNTCHLKLLSHGFSNSHEYMHHKNEMSQNLVAHYINNPNCEFLQKFVDHYDFFQQLNVGFNVNVGSYLCHGYGHAYTYTYEVYEKQKLLFYSAKTCKRALLIGNYMGHIAFIMLMANPNIQITCIDKQENRQHILLLESHFQTNIHFLTATSQDEIASSIPSLNHSYDFIHISQQHPSREYLNTYVDMCIQETKLPKLTFMIDDYNVYPGEMIERIRTNNSHCHISNERIVSGSNTTKIWDMQIHKKYLLLYDDGSEQFKHHINMLIDSAKTYDKSFNIRIFHKKDIDSEFANQNRYILDQHRGGGYWLWKPYIINKVLKEIEENDVLFYIDSKYYFTERFGELYKPLLTQDLLVWRNKPNEPSYSLKNWCKMDIIKKYNIYNAVFLSNMEACWAGAMVMRKTEHVTNMLNEWLTMSCCDDITDRPSAEPNSREFFDHRHDQSLLSIVLWKYKVPLHTFEKRFVQNERQPY